MAQHTLRYWHLQAAKRSEAIADENTRYPECAATWLLGAAYHYEQAGDMAKATALKDKAAALIAPKPAALHRTILDIRTIDHEQTYLRPHDRS